MVSILPNLFAIPYLPQTHARHAGMQKLFNCDSAGICDNRRGGARSRAPNDVAKHRLSRGSYTMSKLPGFAIGALAWTGSASALSDKIRALISHGRNKPERRSTPP